MQRLPFTFVVGRPIEKNGRHDLIPNEGGAVRHTEQRPVRVVPCSDSVVQIHPQCLVEGRLCPPDKHRLVYVA